MNEKVRTYLDSLIPKNIPKKKRQEIFDEYISHIYDKIDFFTEIGYDNETATQKALSEMGDTKEIKDEIKTSFETLYKERTYMAVVIGVLVFAMNILSGFFGIWVTNGTPDLEQVIVSFVSVLTVVCLISILYIKGYRKSLIGVGISNTVIALIPLWCFYPQCAAYGFFSSVIYIIDRFTPLVMREIDWYYGDMSAFYGAFIFTILSAVLSFILSVRIKKKGLPKERAKNKAGLILAATLVLGLLSVVPYETADDYFDNYPVWFDEHNDDIIEDTQNIFDILDENFTYDDAKKLLVSNGYTDTVSYMKNLDKNTLKKFKYNFENMDISFGETAEVYFNRDYIEKNISEYKDGNSFVVIDKNSDGKISLKGIGCLSSHNKDKYGSYRHNGHRQDDIKKCMEAFDNLRKGDSKDEVLSVFGSQYGEIYTLITEYKENRKTDYVRAYFSGEYFEKDYKDFTAYLEFNFEEDVLTSGIMYYEELTGSKVSEEVLEIKNN